MRRDDDFFLILGTLLTLIGLALWSIPLALVVAGTAAIIVAFLIRAGKPVDKATPTDRG